MRIQKLSGITVILIGIMSAYIGQDITAALMLIPIGIWLIISRKYLLIRQYKQTSLSITRYRRGA